MTYADIVRAQFAKHRGAVWAMRTLVGLFVLTTYAPLVALDVPLWTNLEDAPSFPWFRALFDPSVFPLGVDVFFNVLMATFPILVVVLWRARAKVRLRLAGVWLVLHVALVLTMLHHQESFRSPVQNWRVAVHEADAAAFWPPVRHHPSERLSQYSLTPPFQRGKLLPGAEPPPDELWPFYLLGADNLGNDVFTRLLYGARIAFTIGVVAVGIYLVIGIVLGALGGYFGGWVDDVVMFFTQAVMTIPALFLILFLVSVIRDPGIYHLMLVIALIQWPTVARLVRGEFFRQREIDYVTAARALGLGDRRVIFRHVLPNTLAPVFVNATFGVAGAILIESTLSFLGLGDPQAPSWGQMLRVGYENAATGRHLVWLGGLAIFFTVLFLNLVGEALRDALDPKLRR